MGSGWSDARAEGAPLWREPRPSRPSGRRLAERRGAIESGLCGPFLLQFFRFNAGLAKSRVTSSGFVAEGVNQ